MLPIKKPHELAVQLEERRWLVEGLWSERAVGIVGGEPKCCKSFLALDIAVAVATGTKCLRRFAVAKPGPVLLFAAEDALHVVRRRLEGIAKAAGVDFGSLDIHVITAPTLRLDSAADQQRLTETVDVLRPRLLVLDPFVRLHRIDENLSAEVAPLLAYLRTLERSYEVSVLLVHHAKKGGSHLRGGQALRGSSELHAWGDSMLYLRRHDDGLLLDVEHRAAEAMANVALELKGTDDALALQIVDRAPQGEPAPPPSTIDRVVAALSASTTPLAQRELRTACRLRSASLVDALAAMERDGRIVRSQDGYALAQHDAASVSVSRASLQSQGSGNRKHKINHALPGETEAGSAGTQPAEG